MEADVTADWSIRHVCILEKVVVAAVIVNKVPKLISQETLMEHVVAIILIGKNIIMTIIMNSDVDNPKATNVVRHQAFLSMDLPNLMAEIVIYQPQIH